jgi:hypothetical protein
MCVVKQDQVETMLVIQIERLEEFFCQISKSLLLKVALAKNA